MMLHRLHCSYLNSGSTVAVHSGLPSGGTGGGSSIEHELIPMILNCLHCSYLNSGSTVAVHSGLPSGGTSGGSSTQGGGRGTSGQQVRGSAPPPNPAPSGDGEGFWTSQQVKDLGMLGVDVKQGWAVPHRPDLGHFAAPSSTI
eukprot:scaffold38148_cov20-Tisochrysis_lutea.AAC.1